MGLFNVLEEKYDSLIDKLELDGARRPQLVLPCLSLILIGFIAVLIVLLLPVSYDLTVKVSLNSEPVPNALLILTSGTSELASFKLDQSGALTFNQELSGVVSSESSSVTFNGKILRTPFTVFAKYNQYNKTIYIQSVFDQNTLLIEFNSNVKGNFKNNTINETLYCTDGTASGNCVNPQGDYCDPQSLTIIKKTYCYACSDGTIKGECSVSKTGYYCNDETNLVEDLTKCSDSKCYNGNEELKSGECSKTDVGYSCDGLTQTLVRNNNCVDVTVCAPNDLACKCKKDPRLCTSANLTTSSMLVTVYDNSSNLLSGMNVSVKLFKQNPVTLSLDELPETLQYTISGLAVFQGLTVGESYKAVATALDCGISGGSNLVQVDVQQVKINVILKVIKTSTGCNPSYDTSNTTIQIGTINNSVFTIFSSSKIAFYDLYPENYLSDYPEEVLSNVQRGVPVFEQRMDASKNYYGIAWTPGYLYSDLQKVQVQGDTLFSLDEQKNSNRSWDPRRPPITANSGNLTVLVLDEADTPLSDVVLNVYDKSFTSISEPISVNKYLYYVSPQSYLGSIKTGYDGISRMSPLKKGATYLVTAVSGAASGSGTVTISDKVNVLVIRLKLHFANVSIKVYDPYDYLPVNSTVKLTYYGDLSTWYCNISSSSPVCVIKKVYAGVPIYVNVTPNDNNYSVGTDAVEYFIIANESFNKREYELTKSRDEPYLSNVKFYDFYGHTLLTYISPTSKLNVRAVLQLPNNKTDWTGIMVRLPDESIISVPVDASAYGFTSLNENSCTATDPNYFNSKRSPTVNGNHQFQLLYWNNSDLLINYPRKQVPISFNIQTNLLDGIDSYAIDYSAFSQANQFTLRNPLDSDLQRNFSISNLNFCQANKTKSTSLFVTNPKNTICSNSYCFTLNYVKVLGSKEILSKSDSILNLPGKVVVNGYLQFQEAVSSSNFNSITVSGGDSIRPLKTLIDFVVSQTNAPNPNPSTQNSYSFTPNIPASYSIPASSTPYPVEVTYNVTGVSGSSILSIAFPKVNGNQVNFQFPLSVTESSTGSGNQSNQYLISRDPRDCNGNVVISKKGDELVPSCTNIVLRLTSIFPADGVLFNYVGGFTPDLIKIEERNTTNNLGSAYADCFDASKINNAVDPTFRFSAFGFRPGNACPYSKFGPVGNGFNSTNGIILEGKIRFGSKDVSGTTTINFTVKVSELENIFNTTMHFQPAYYAFKTKIWNPVIDPGVVEARFENVSLVGVYYNSQLRQSFSSTDQPQFTIGNLERGPSLQQLGKTNPIYFYVNEKDPAYSGPESIGFKINTQTTQEGSGSFIEKQSYPVIPLENVLLNSVQNDPVNAMSKASQLCKLTQAFDLLINNSVFYQYTQGIAMYCATNYNNQLECRSSVEAWKNQSSVDYPQTFTCTGQKPVGSSNSDAFYTICNEHFTTDSQLCDYTASKKCINPSLASKVYSYDASCVPGDFTDRTGSKDVAPGQLLKFYDPTYAKTFAYAYGADDKDSCSISLAISRINQVESTSYTQNDALTKFTLKSGETVLHLQDSSANSLLVYCVRDNIRCSNPTPFDPATNAPYYQRQVDILKSACNWNCSTTTGSLSVTQQKIVENWENVTPLIPTTPFQNPITGNQIKKLPYDLFSDVVLDNLFEFNFPVNLMYDYQPVINDLSTLIAQGKCGNFPTGFALNPTLEHLTHNALTADNGIYNFKVKVVLREDNSQSNLRNPLDVSFTPISVDNSRTNTGYGLGFTCDKTPSSQPYLYGKVYAFGGGCIVGNNLVDVDSYDKPWSWKHYLTQFGSPTASLWHCTNDGQAVPGHIDDQTKCAKPLVFDSFTVAQKTGTIFFPEKSTFNTARDWSDSSDYSIKILTIDKDLSSGLTSVFADAHWDSDLGTCIFPSRGSNSGGTRQRIADGINIQILTDKSTSHACGHTGKYNGVEMCSDNC